jgi:hypothetical protein
MTTTIFSYNGMVTIGFATDAHLVPDPEVLVELVVDEVGSMMRLLVGSSDDDARPSGA